jgi:hypothetical protein
MTKLLPCLLIALNIGSSAVYLFSGDWKRSIYWIAAAVLTACVTF